MERPIIFTAESVRAILAGAKTQTRRVVRARHPLEFIGGQGQRDDPSCWGYFFDGPAQHGWMVLGRGLNEDFDGGSVSIQCPYGEPGDRLWVREAYALAATCSDPDPDDQDDWHPVYRADGDERQWLTSLDEDAAEVKPPWRSPIFMPRWASRITLKVEEVRVQRLQNISEDDARADGVEPYVSISPWQRIPGPGFGDCRLGDQPHRLPFSDRWDQINGRRAPWSANPWVWAVTFGMAPRAP